MRILTRKIYRAYPELDKFEDDVCKRYIKRAKRLQNAWKLWAIIIIALPLSWTVWLGVMYYTGYLLGEIYYNISEVPETIIILVVGTGIAWMPAFTVLLIRDRWLHRCIRKQLTGVQCPSCGYSLLGLTLAGEDGSPAVNCPECGLSTILKDMGLNESDIDPSLIGAQA